MFNLNGKTIFITGAAGGMAKEFIPMLKKAGANINSADRNTDKLEVLKQEGLLNEYIAGDLTNPSIQDEITLKFGEFTDILINNVGGGFSKTLEDTSREDFLFL